MTLGLELGGKDPAYVRADAKLDHAVENLVDGAFFNSGQCCCGIERIYVHEKVYDASSKASSRRRKGWLGNPLEQTTWWGRWRIALRRLRPRADRRGAAQGRDGAWSTRRTRE
jgi:acyl-CoA reductase-like NAD-dependent aldehyde dehydrogenase